MKKTKVQFTVIVETKDGDDEKEYMVKCSNIEWAIQQCDGVESVETEIGEEL